MIQESGEHKLDALLVAAQHIDDRLATRHRAHNGGWESGIFSRVPVPFGSAALEFYPEHRPLKPPRAREESGLTQCQQTQRPEILSVRSIDEDRTATAVHLHRAQKAFDEMAKSREHTLRLRQFEEETHWIAENRSRFAGQWVALQGKHLLAVGATAKEVFQKTINEKTPPLVTLVDSGDLPFAGW